MIAYLIPIIIVIILVVCLDYAAGRIINAIAVSTALIIKELNKRK